MGFSGDLHDLPLNDILYVLSNNGKSGHLSLTTATDEITLTLRGGTVSTVTSTDGTLRIGRLLVDRGYVSEDQIEQALALQAVSSEQSRIGDLLVDVGYVTREQIQTAVSGQLEESIFRILVQTGGTFTFTSTEDVESEPIVKGIQLEPMILNAMRLADEWLASNSADQTVQLPDEIIDPAVLNELAEDERDTLIAVLNGHTTLHALARATGLSARGFRTAIDSLQERGLVEITNVDDKREESMPLNAE